MSNDQFIMCIGDIHAPFHCNKTIDSIVEAARIFQPSTYVQMGDAWDFYSFGRWARSYNVMTPAEEIVRGRKVIESFWKRLQDASPQADCRMIVGNHEDRLNRSIAEKFPEIEGLINTGALFNFEGVTTQPDAREELIIDDICFIHGYRSKLGDHARHNQMSTVVGHTHRGGVWHGRIGDKPIFELNAGHCVDPYSIPLSYTKQRKISNWIRGYGIIDSLGPRFIALEPQ